uniref:Uncharacterized protein n=1 Tax=Ixodes ricinus TaxID=34613 RepID=A0A6B0UXF1_IXORI
MTHSLPSIVLLWHCAEAPPRAASLRSNLEMSSAAVCLVWPVSSTSLLPCIMLVWSCTEAPPKAESLWRKRGNSETPSVTCQEHLPHSLNKNFPSLRQDILCKAFLSLSQGLGERKTDAIRKNISQMSVLLRCNESVSCFYSSPLVRLAQVRLAMAALRTCHRK